MRINNIKLTVLLFILAIIQIIVNNTTILYIDLFGIILVILLVNDIYPISGLILISLIADVIGHWYLGSHLCALITISFAASHFVNFYKMCTSLQKSMIIGMFYALFVGMIVVIGAITHSLHFNWMSFAIEIIILVPILLWLFNGFVVRTTQEYIF